MPGPSGARRVAAVALSALGVLIVAAVLAGFVVHLPYVVISPGAATPLDSSVVTISGAPTYTDDGDVLFLTVRVSGHDPTVWKLVTSWLDADDKIVDRTTVVGCLSDAENVAINARLMEQSQDDAKKVALERIGYAVVASPEEVVVVEVCPGAPAYGTLRAGDQLLSVDDQPIGGTATVGAFVQARRPGDNVSVEVARGGVNKAVDVRAGRVARDGTCTPVRGRTGGSACLGIAAQSFVPYTFPIDVSIDTSRIGGPSAGLAFALAIVDDLTPGSLTGGKRVAVTGAIDAAARVQPVGGVEQKAITARREGVDLMLVPRAELGEARRGAGDVRVVGVDTFEEALTALQALGGTPVPPPGPAPARS